LFAAKIRLRLGFNFRYQQNSNIVDKAGFALSEKWLHRFSFKLLQPRNTEKNKLPEADLRGRCSICHLGLSANIRHAIHQPPQTTFFDLFDNGDDRKKELIVAFAQTCSSIAFAVQQFSPKQLFKFVFKHLTENATLSRRDQTHETRTLSTC